MNFGFNSNVRVGGALYHVQTEDRGSAHPFLDTIVYKAGRVVHKRSVGYADVVADIESGKMLPQQLHERLALQHKDVIAQLESGSLILNDISATGADREPLDISVENASSWLSAGNVTLQVAVRRRGSPATGAEVDAFLEGATDRSIHFRATADDQGHATLKFKLPDSATEGTSLVIQATADDVSGELRFRLKTKN